MGLQVWAVSVISVVGDKIRMMRIPAVVFLFANVAYSCTASPPLARCSPSSWHMLHGGRGKLHRAIATSEVIIPHVVPPKNSHIFIKVAKPS